MTWQTLQSGQYSGSHDQLWTARLEKNEKGKYRIDFWIAGTGGKRIRKRKNVNVLTDAAAVQFFQKSLSELIPSMAVVKEKKNTWSTLGDWYVDVYQAKNAEATRVKTRTQLAHFIQYCNDRQIEPDDLTGVNLVDFQSFLLRKFQPSSTNVFFSRLKHFINTLLEYEKIKSAPKKWPGSVREKEKTPIKYTRDELVKLFSDEAVQQHQYYLPSLFISRHRKKSLYGHSTQSFFLNQTKKKIPPEYFRREYKK